MWWRREHFSAPAGNWTLVIQPLAYSVYWVSLAHTQTCAHTCTNGVVKLLLIITTVSPVTCGIYVFLMDLSLAFSAISFSFISEHTCMHLFIFVHLPPNCITAFRIYWICCAFLSGMRILCQNQKKWLDSWKTSKMMSLCFLLLFSQIQSHSCSLAALNYLLRHFVHNLCTFYFFNSSMICKNIVNIYFILHIYVVYLKIIQWSFKFISYEVLL